MHDRPALRRRSQAMTPRQAMDFVRYHGLVLESAKGADPSLAERVAGQPINGSWWAHPKGDEIYELTKKMRESAILLVCTLARGRITYIHRRLWPAFVHMVKRFPPHALDQLLEVHLPSGRHKREDVPFPTWVPQNVVAHARLLSQKEATDEIHIWLDRYGILLPQKPVTSAGR